MSLFQFTKINKKKICILIFLVIILASFITFASLFQIILSFLFFLLIPYVSLSDKKQGMYFAICSFIFCLIFNFISFLITKVNIYLYFCYLPFVFLLLGYFPFLLEKEENKIKEKYEKIYLPKIKEYKTIEKKELELENINNQLKNQINTFESLYQISKLIHSILEMEPMIILVKENFERIIKFPNWFFFLVYKEEKKVILKFSIKPQEKIFFQEEFDISSTTNFIGWLANQKKIIHSVDVKKDKIFSELLYNPQIYSFFYLPFLIKEEVIGFLCNFNFSEEFLEKEEINKIIILSGQLTIGIEKVLLYSKVQKMSITDSITGLYNRRQLYKLFDQELNRSNRYKKTFSLILLDVDNFKTYNDTHGHLTGDRVLKEIGKLILLNIREFDIVGRYGGEEFIIILPEISKEKAKEVGENLRKYIENYKFIVDNSSITLTVSMGISTFPDDGSIRENLINKADYAVYQAKAKGKNCVVVFNKN